MTHTFASISARRCDGKMTLVADAFRQARQNASHFESIYCWQRLLGNPQCAKVFSELDL